MQVVSVYCAYDALNASSATKYITLVLHAVRIATEISYNDSLCFVVEKNQYIAVIERTYDRPIVDFEHIQKKNLVGCSN